MTSSQQTYTPMARWLALISICLAVFLIPQSMSAVSIALPAIAESLQADAVLVSWIPSANLWGSIILMLPAGRVADHIGRKRVYLFGVAGFGLSSLLVFVAETVEFLIFLRVLQGLASGLVFATAMAIVANVFSQHNRGMALGFTATSVYLGLTCGPLLGGWLTEHIGWRSVFWVPVPLAVVALGLVALCVRRDPPPEAEFRLDWLGSLLFMVLVSLLLYGLTGLPEWPNWIALIAGLGLIVVFVSQQERARYPLVRFRLLAANRVMNRSLITSFLMYSGNAPTLFLLSLYLQYLKGLSPAESGELMLLQAVMMALLAPISGRLSDRIQPRYIATIGCLIFSSGFALLVFVQADSSLGYITLSLLLLGIGFGLFSSPNNNAALGAVDQQRLGIASALLNLARTSGNMFSMAVTVLLVSLFLGDQQISPAQYPLLLDVVRLGFIIALVSTLAAAWCSFSRGNIER